MSLVNKTPVTSAGGNSVTSRRRTGHFRLVRNQRSVYIQNAVIIDDKGCYFVLCYQLQMPMQIRSPVTKEDFSRLDREFLNS